MTNNIINFDTNNYRFKEILQDIFDTENLEEIHLKYKDNLDKELYNKFNDDKSYFHKIFKESSLLESFKKEYNKLIKHIMINNYKDEKFIIYQAFPAIRISYPGNRSVGELHKDEDYNHPEEEMNYWFPVTKTSEHNTCWYETGINSNKYIPLIINYGQIAEVYFNKLRHYCPINESNKTRISFDFRIIPGSKWGNVNSKKETLFNNIKFQIGNYYNKLENPKILLELRICTKIQETHLFKKGFLENNEKRIEQYIRGIKRLLEYKKLWENHNLDIYITDNTSDNINVQIKEILPENIKIICSNNNNFGCKNKGAGDIEQWIYCKDLICKYDFFIHFEPRLYLENFDFIDNFLNNPRDLFVYGAGKNHFFTGLFGIQTNILLDYIKNFNSPDKYRKLGSIEFNLFNYINKAISYDTLNKANVIWRDKVTEKKYHF